MNYIHDYYKYYEFYFSMSGLILQLQARHQGKILNSRQANFE